ncbi:hypothetical protein IWW38_000086 [Coemansia aciculifera]|uniref:Uncharacterized protein n=1 Tax=Coemansia aciculifera TaxID=417176 RepID=A0ACC1MB08_9FUNG|nr:hypothetical protein IWW38_000086 [Coemansia aciculifera]
MRRSQSLSGTSFSPSEHQHYEEYQARQQQQHTHLGGLPVSVTPMRSRQGGGGGGAASLHTPSGTTMQSEHLAQVTRSDSKYSSQTVASRSGDQRRSRQMRRKTDCSDEIQSMRRPSTSHASSPPRKIAYSQYPDFESITDPFAKRDKIPQKSERPFLLDAAAASATVTRTVRSKEDDPHSALAHSRSQHRQNSESSKPLNGTAKQTIQAVAALSETSSGDHDPEPQTKVPTPLKTRDKIPRQTVQQRAEEPQPAPLRMESMGSTPGGFLVTPTKPRPAATSTGAPRSMGKSLLISSLVSPVSPAYPTATDNGLRSSGSGTVSRMPLAQFSSDATEMTALSTPVRPFSGHKSSPRLKIDMDKVDTLYARRSVIFEKNKSKVRERAESTIASPLSQQACLPASTAGFGLMAMVDEAKDGEYAEDTDDQEGEHHIPFDQVLIPTAFKRLRAALEDPTFEIDEETYRRFKLSERWYSREEQMQMERSFAQGTFGESKKRSRVVQKRLSEISADSSALGHGHSPIDLPTPPASAQSLHDRHNQRLESLREEESGLQEPAVAAAPERRRTRSSRRPSRRHRHHDADGLAAIPQQAPLPGEYAPPPMEPTYGAQPGTRMHGAAADYEQRQQQPTSDQAIRQHRNSRRHRPVAPPSIPVVEQAEKPSSGCCGCTIM